MGWGRGGVLYKQTYFRFPFYLLDPSIFWGLGCMHTKGTQHNTECTIILWGLVSHYKICCHCYSLQEKIYKNNKMGQLKICHFLLPGNKKDIQFNSRIFIRIHTTGIAHISIYTPMGISADYLFRFQIQTGM